MTVIEFHHKRYISVESRRAASFKREKVQESEIMESPGGGSTPDSSQRLVIDEPEMEVDSDDTNDLSELAAYAKEASELENDTENDSSVPRAQSPMEQTSNAAEAIPKTTSSQGSSAKPKHKRVSHSNSFRLAALVDSTTTELHVSASPAKFYNMRLFMMPNSMLSAEYAAHTDPTPDFSFLTTDQVINSPYIRITINIRDLTLTRTMRPNYAHDVVFGGDPLINVDTKPNIMATRLCTAIVSSKKNPKVYTPILLTYFSAIIEAAAIAKLSQARRNELAQIFQNIQNDFESVKLAELKMDYTRFLNPHKYVRLFNNDVNYNKAKAVGPKVLLRETINPEVVFSVDKCKFDIDHPSNWEKGVLDYLGDLLSKRHPIALNALTDMLKKCVMISCTICNTSFEGVMCILTMKGHLADHYHKKKFSCVKCKKEFDTLDLAKSDWAHDCSESHNLSL